MESLRRARPGATEASSGVPLARSLHHRRLAQRGRDLSGELEERVGARLRYVLPGLSSDLVLERAELVIATGLGKPVKLAPCYIGVTLEQPTSPENVALASDP